MARAFPFPGPITSPTDSDPSPPGDAPTLPILQELSGQDEEWAFATSCWIFHGTALREVLMRSGKEDEAQSLENGFNALGEIIVHVMGEEKAGAIAKDPMMVAQQMGHKDWGMIRRVYGRWIPDLNPEAGNKMMAAWAKLNTESTTENE